MKPFHSGDLSVICVPVPLMFNLADVDRVKNADVCFVMFQVPPVMLIVLALTLANVFTVFTVTLPARLIAALSQEAVKIGLVEFSTVRVEPASKLTLDLLAELEISIMPVEV